MSFPSLKGNKYNVLYNMVDLIKLIQEGTQPLYFKVHPLDSPKILWYIYAS